MLIIKAHCIAFDGQHRHILFAGGDRQPHQLLTSHLKLAMLFLRCRSASVMSLELNDRNIRTSSAQPAKSPISSRYCIIRQVPLGPGSLPSF
jgi:hypothetical protein